VFFWIHGGGFVAGAGIIYNGTYLASHFNVIVVNINYRLGPLGFLVHPELQQEYGANGGLNGLNDAIVALKWVNAHIGSFGGDNKQITVFGESAGGMATCLLTVSPLARGLFKYSIIQSGACVGPWSPGEATLGLATSQQVLTLLNATSIADLRAIPTENATLFQWPALYMNTHVNFPAHYLDGLVSVTRLV
jgi:para-nitrobenzyl esterase